MVLVPILALVGCTSSEPVDTVVAGADGDERLFCQAWEAAVASGDDNRLLVVLEKPPEALAEPAAALIAAQKADGSGGNQAGDSGREVSQWVELNCNPGDAAPGAQASERRLAPPGGATPEGVVLCSAGGGLPEDPGDKAGVVLYGRGSDPYSGPMIGVIWGEGGGDHSGDGASKPVRVRGTEGLAAPITVFQQVVLEELGTVIAWEEQGHSVGLYGRGWSVGQAGELVSIAEQLVLADGGYRLPEAALPPGLRQVFVGKPGSMSLVVGPAEYEVSYRVGDAGTSAPSEDSDRTRPWTGGVVTLSGFVASPEEYEAVRFFAPGLSRKNVKDRLALVGSAWSDAGPAVVTWREPDGLVVRIVGLGAEPEVVKAASEAARELTRPEWVDLVKTSGDCSSR